MFGSFAFLFFFVFLDLDDSNLLEWLGHQGNDGGGDADDREAKPETAKTAEVANQIDESGGGRVAIHLVEDWLATDLDAREIVVLVEWNVDKLLKVILLFHAIELTLFVTFFAIIEEAALVDGSAEHVVGREQTSTVQQSRTRKATTLVTITIHDTLGETIIVRLHRFRVACMFVATIIRMSANVRQTYRGHT